MTIADTIADLERKHAESTSGEWHRDYTTIYTDIDLGMQNHQVSHRRAWWTGERFEEP